jgi:D-alanine-D-alanine ligase
MRVSKSQRLRITVLTYVEKKGGEWDVVVDQVAESLKSGGHKAKVLAIHDDVRELIEGIEKQRPHLVFNLCEQFGKNVFGEVAVAGVLDSLGVAHTGGGPGEFYLQQDKALTKELLAYHGVPFPNYVVFRRAAYPETIGRLRMPLIVKPLRMDASIGIEAASLVRSTTQMMKRVVAIHEKVKDSALVEEYIEGREFYVGVMGNRKPVALPPIEMDFSGMPPGLPRILGRRAKWVKSSREYKGTTSRIAEIPDALLAKLQRVSIEAYRALRVRDYGRIDLRVTPGGEVYVIEVNASCYLEKTAEFATSAKAAGLSYTELIPALARLALARSRRPF